MAAAKSGGRPRARPRSPAARKAGPHRSARRGPSAIATLLTLVGVMILVGLGVWQLQRKAWKEHLLSRIAALQAAPPEPLSVVLNRVKDGGELDFVRVVAPCAALGPRSTHLYGLRDGEGPQGGPGWRQIAACKLDGPDGSGGGPYGSILVDTGFDATPALAKPVAEPMVVGRNGLRLTGVLRQPDPRPWYAALIGLGARRSPQSQASGEWFERDIPGMAAVLDAPRPAPVMLMLESPAAGPNLVPSALPTDIPNRHLEYALTWFGLAGTLVVFYAVVLLRGRRGR